MNGPGRGYGDAKNSANSTRFDNRRKGFIEVNAMLLRVTTTNPTSFVMRKTAIGVKFVTKNPLAGYNIGTRRTRNKMPCFTLSSNSTPSPLDVSVTRAQEQKGA